jgi:NADPH:quinone reductase-like Zn-dependent oxidoreductase
MVLRVVAVSHRITHLNRARAKMRSNGGILVKAPELMVGVGEQIFFEDAPMPEDRRGDVLVVQVCATGITPAELTWDETYQSADRTPGIPGIPGHEVSEMVERMAADVTDFRIGDEVYGLVDFPRDGAAAEFAAMRATNLALKPRSIPHAQAAALPLSALTAWQALFEHAHLAAEQSVLIHGGEAPT